MPNQPGQRPEDAPTKSFCSLVDRERILLAFIVTLVGMDVFYRIELARVIYSPHSKLWLIEPAGVALHDFLKSLISDLVFVSFAGVCYLLFKLRLRAWLPKWTAMKVFSAGETAVALTFLLSVALIMQTHFELLAQLGIGLSFNLLATSRRILGAGDICRMMAPLDIVFLVTAPIIFALALVFGGAVRRFYKPLAVSLAGTILAFQLLPTYVVPSWRIGHHPVLYLFDVALRNEKRALMPDDSYGHSIILPGPAQMNSIALIDTAFTGTNTEGETTTTATGLAPDGHRWNIMIFVMESTGSQYVFDNSDGQPTPMPFLKQICSQGLYLSNHYTTADISQKAAFSIFTGLYPPPSGDETCMEPNWDVPTVNHYLGTDYDYFIVQPSMPTFCFPYSLFFNNGLKEMDSMVNIPAGPQPDRTTEARNELDCFDFLQARLDRASEPFFAVYWSFAPHSPYSDYGPDYRVRHDLKNNRDCYYNNLRLLDSQMHRIWNHLEDTGAADHTIFVVVGDHGEAFGQHPGFWGHALGSYNEAYRVPAVFWQPNLIKPQTIQFATSHVDIVPTLLDLLGLRYDPSRFQGYSVLRGPPDRKYIFTMDGFGDCMSAITPEMKKVSLSFVNDSTSSAFDLAADPGETHPINRSRFPDEIQAILKFRNYQTRMISECNSACLNCRRFPVPAPGTTAGQFAQAR